MNQRQLEQRFRAMNPISNVVTLECARSCPAQVPSGNIVVSGVDGGELGMGHQTVYVPLTWNTKVLAMDASGPLYADPFCPQCTFRGRRETITAYGIGELLTEEEISAIGQERMHTMLFLITQMVNPNDYREEKQLFPLLTTAFIGKSTAQLSSAVFDHIQWLDHSCWLEALQAGMANVSTGGIASSFSTPQFKIGTGARMKPFFERIAAKAGQQVAESEKLCNAIDCGHETRFQVMNSEALAYMTDELFSQLKDKIADGTIHLHRPLLCAACAEKEAKRHL